MPPEFNRRRSDGPANLEHLRGGLDAHELRNLVNTAVVAFEVLKAGNACIHGHTAAAVVDRSLTALRSWLAGMLADARLAGVSSQERILLVPFIEQIAAGAALEAAARDLTLTVTAVEAGLAVVGDSQTLSAVVVNLLQNAFKFTHPRSTVTLRVGASAERVLIQVQDECGGLPGGDGNAELLFRPFEQRSADRTGAGLGLAISRSGAQAHNGRLYARNAGNGCVFTVDLPRAPADLHVVTKGISC